MHSQLTYWTLQWIANHFQPLPIITHDNVTITYDDSYCYSTINTCNYDLYESHSDSHCDYNDISHDIYDSDSSYDEYYNEHDI
jgi:hypothetical protein